MCAWNVCYLTQECANRVMAKSVLFDIQVKKVRSSSHLFILLLEMLYWLFLENKKVSMYMRSILSVIDRGILYTLSALLIVNTST